MVSAGDNSGTVVVPGKGYSKGALVVLTMVITARSSGVGNGGNSGAVVVSAMAAATAQ